MKDSHLHYYSLLQIYQDKIHIKNFYHKSAEHLNSDQYISKYSAFDKMIHEITDSVTISIDKIAAV